MATSPLPQVRNIPKMTWDHFNYLASLLVLAKGELTVTKLTIALDEDFPHFKAEPFIKEYLKLVKKYERNFLNK